MKQMNNSIIALFIILFNQTVFGESTKFPIGCRSKDFTFENKLVSLSTEEAGSKQTIYMIHNISEKPINLMLKSDTNQTDLRYRNTIESLQWGAFVMDEKQMTFTCQLPIEGKIQVDCQSVLEICRYTNTKFPEGNDGVYWAVASEGLEKIKKDIINQGILLR